MEKEILRIMGQQTMAPHPEYLSLLDKVASLSTDVLGAGVRLEALAQERKGLESTTRQLLLHDTVMSELTRRRTDADAIYNVLLNRAHQLRVLTSNEIPPYNFAIVDPPRLPKFKDIKKPPYVLIVLFLPFICAFNSVMVVLFVDYWDNSVRYAEEVEELLGLPVLGEIPSWTHRKTTRSFSSQDPDSRQST